MDKILDSDMSERKDLDKKDFKFYKSFHNVEEAKEFAKILDSKSILYLAESTDTILDKSIVGTGMLPKVIIKILAKDFKKVNGFIAYQIAELDYADVADHYLNQLDNGELLEIFAKPDEWSIEDANVAKLIVRQRGIEISKEEISDLRRKRLTSIRAGKSEHKLTMLLYFGGIIVGLLFSPLFVIAGLGMGYYYGFSKNVDLDGEKYFTFDATTRGLGKLMLIVGIVILVFEMLVILKIMEPVGY
ncbi:MAG: hypothetical protein ACI9XO_003053 [Paraglaciecola sp.]|jgi:hypothetical protein